MAPISPPGGGRLPGKKIRGKGPGVFHLLGAKGKKAKREKGENFENIEPLAKFSLQKRIVILRERSD
jgi:hypothetical protein